MWPCVMTDISLSHAGPSGMKHFFVMHTHKSQFCDVW